MWLLGKFLTVTSEPAIRIFTSSSWVVNSLDFSMIDGVARYSIVDLLISMEVDQISA